MRENSPETVPAGESSLPPLDLLRAALNGLAEGVVVHDARGEIVVANPAAEQILGVSFDQLRGRTPLDPRWRAIHADGTAFPGESHPASITLRTGAPQSRVVMGLEVPGRATTTWIEIESRPILVPGSSRPVGVVASFSDETAARSERLALERLTRVLHTLFTSEQRVALADDEESLYRFVCEGLASEGLLRLAWVGRVDRAAQRLVPAASAGPVTDYLSRIGVRIDDSEFGQGPSGRCARLGTMQICQDVAEDPRMRPWRDLQLSRGIRSSGAFPLKLGGEVVAVLTVYLAEANGFGPAESRLFMRLAESVSAALQGFENARALRATQVQLLQAQKMEAVGRLAGGVAHDFNNLLGVIVVEGGLLLDGLPAESALREDVGQILSAARRAAELTRRLLTFSRQAPSESRDIDVPAVVRDLEPMLRRVIGEDVRLELVLPGQPLHARLDPVHVEQMVMNFVVNARDAMPHGGRLTIGLKRAAAGDIPPEALGRPGEGAFVHLWVRDTGEGIAPEVAEKIFDPFFTTKPVGRGTGLGLSTVFGIVTQAGGRVYAESTPGAGTTMHVFVPELLAPVADVRPAQAVLKSSPTGQGRHVLLVEDEEVVRRVVVRSLERHGYEVTATESAEAALAAFRQAPERFALVVSDLLLPEMDGVALAAELERVRAGVKVLFMSGWAKPELQEEARSRQLLSKPFTREELLHAVARALEEAPG